VVVEHAELTVEAGIPEGLVNVVTGAGATGALLCAHPGIDGISFTGSVPTGRKVATAAATTFKNVVLELGGKAPNVVFADADLDAAVRGCVWGVFNNTGQACVATSRLLVERPVLDAVIERLVTLTGRLRTGDPLDPTTHLGPLVSSDRRDIVRSWIDKGEAEGASIVLDGRTENGDNSAGAFVGPTIMDDVTPSMDVAREEIFGPVLSVVKVETLDEAIAVVNGSRYGNGSSIFTESGAVARRYRHDCDAGMIGVNIGVAAPVAFFPFSGWKDSFLGDLHAHGGDAIDFYTRKTTVTTRWNSQGESGKFFVE